MNKLLILLLFFYPNKAKAQVLNNEKASNNVTIIPCHNLTYINRNDNGIITEYEMDLINLCSFIFRDNWIRYETNDALKAKQCIRVKLDSNKVIQSNRVISEIEKTLNCKLIDSILLCEVWIIKPGTVHNIKPLTSNPLHYSNKFIPYTEGVYCPDTLLLNEPLKNFISKNGRLGQIRSWLEYKSKRIVVIENGFSDQEKYTFELPSYIILTSNFEEIKAALKEAIDFDLYKEIRPIKKTYIKFLK